MQYQDAGLSDARERYAVAQSRQYLHGHCLKIRLLHAHVIDVLKDVMIALISHDAQAARVRVAHELRFYQVAIDAYGQIVTELILRLWVRQFA